MSRRKNKLWIPKSVMKIKGIIALFLDTHPAGLAVLTGRCQFPTKEEVHEMLSCARPCGDTGVPIQGGRQIYQAQRQIELFESEKTLFDVLDRYGGKDRLQAVISEYAENYPENYSILQEIGNIGKPNARSLEAIAGRYHMDVKTLRNTKERIIEEIAMGMVFYGDDFRLF